MQTRFRTLMMMSFLTAALAACATGPKRVTADVFECCEARFERYETYQVEITNAPGFLEPYLHAGVTASLARKGLRETLDRPDLMVNLMFNQVFLSREDGPDDYFGAGVDSAAATRFMAAVEVDMLDLRSSQIVWSGRLSRIHNDPFGQPRGNDHKMQGIIDGFDELFASYPIRLQDKNEQQ